MIYLGLDASTTKTGYAIFDDDKLIEYGYIEPCGEWRDRVCEIARELIKLIRKHKIEQIYIEDVPLIKSKSTHTAISLGVVQGMVLTIASALKISIDFIPVASWRSLLGLFDGTAEGKKRVEMKRKSIELANKIFDLKLKWKSNYSKENEDDISDAILIAYSQIKKKIKGF